MSFKEIFLKSGLIKETPKPKSASTATPAGGSFGIPPVTTSLGAPPAAASAPISVDPTLKAKVLQNIATQDAPAFRAFSENVERLGVMPQMKSDQVLLLTTAAMTTPNATPLDIIQGARARVAACEAERQKFNQNREDMLQQHVTSKEGEITALDGQIQQARKALQELIAREQAKVGELEARKAGLVDERTRAQAEIDQQTISYEAVFAELLGELNTDASRITTILQATPPTTGGTR